VSRDNGGDGGNGKQSHGGNGGNRLQHESDLYSQVVPRVQNGPLVVYGGVQKAGHASRKYTPNGIHQMKSFVMHKTRVDGGHAPVAMSQERPSGPRTLPLSPTAAMSQPRSGVCATLR